MLINLIDIAVADLRLDGENPRHDPTKGEQKIVAALLADGGGKGGDKIVQLGTDIAAHGLSPIDPLMVIKDGSAYTVLEGNRRLTAVRLLTNPKLTSDPGYASAFSALAKMMAAPITQITCHVVATRAEAIHWQELRHGGEAKGRGVVPWDPPARARFFPATRGQTANAVLLADALKAAYPHNAAMLADLKWVMKNNSSTVGRLLGDRGFRNRIGVVLKPKFAAHYSSADLELVFMKIMADLNGTITVSDLHNGTQREKYLADLAAVLPDLAKRQAHASALTPLHSSPPPLPALAPTTPPPAAPTGAAPTPMPAPVPTSPGGTPVPLPGKATPTPVGPRHLFEGIRLSKFSVRVQNVLGEIQRLDVDAYPNASAVLMRVVINLAVVEVFEKNTWPMTHPAAGPGKQPKDKSLAEMVRECLTGLDSSGKDKKWTSVRNGLTEPNGMLATSTLNAWLHDPHFNPVPSYLRPTAANYSNFLAALDTLV
jgi:hypothetical protein